MPLALLILAALHQQWPTVPDSGVVPNAHRVTPAGVQTVFESRVTGVRFGASARELWVAAHGSAYRIDWAGDRVIARAKLGGRAGVQGVAYDPVRQRAVVSSVGRVPARATEAPIPGTAQLQPNRSVAQISLFDDRVTGDSALPAFSSGALGDYMAGAPAVARVAGADGRRVAVLPLPANDRLALLDAETGAPLGAVPLGVAPIAAVVSADGTTAWVTNFGGEPPAGGDRGALQCCLPRAERVAVDARGIALPGTVSRIDLVARRVTARIPVGRHPTGLALDETRHRLYVANGNDDAVTVIDTDRNTAATTIAVAPFRTRAIGLAPTAVALAPDGSRLFVALGGINAVAIYAIAGDPHAAGFASLRGLVPTAWYPSSLDVSADGRYLAVGALFGVGSGTGETEGSPGKRGRYVFAERGSVNVVTLPDDARLAAFSAAVASNMHLALAAAPTAAESAAVAPVAPAARAVPARPGDPSLVKHVVYIIKENRTYDQILGDLGRGDSDSSLVIFGRGVTPNQHALAEQFVTLDRTFASGGNSADGHQWLTQANETEYAMWPLYHGRSYPSEGEDALVYSSGGFLWEAAAAKGKRVAVFGEYAPSIQNGKVATHRALFDEWQAHRAGPSAYFRELLAKRYTTRSTIPSLDAALVREYPGWTEEVPDVVKAEDVLAHLKDWEAAGAMPDLVMIILPNDHTVGTAPGWCTPAACVADNDLALGRLVDGFSHSTFWREMAILVIEDDAQNGVDHVDGHRTTAFVASPFAKRGAVDHTTYNQPSMVKTIELMLGLPSLSVFDLVATDMRESFIGPGDAPDVTPFTMIEPAQSLFERNQRVGAITGPSAAARRRAALASARVVFDGPDEAPSELLNRILWRDARGWTTPYPTVKRALFFPMSRDVDDGDREAKGERR